MCMMVLQGPSYPQTSVYDHITDPILPQIKANSGNIRLPTLNQSMMV